MNGTLDPSQMASVTPQAYPPSYTYTAPSWPPPSGGYPNVTPEMGPILNPYPYGTAQTANISTSPPAPPGGWPIPWGPLKGTAYPQKMPVGANGQNQGPGYGLPPLSANIGWEVGPIKASPSISAISPPPSMGPIH